MVGNVSNIKVLWLFGQSTLIFVSLWLSLNLYNWEFGTRPLLNFFVILVIMRFHHFHLTPRAIRKQGFAFCLQVRFCKGWYLTFASRSNRFGQKIQISSARHGAQKRSVYNRLVLRKTLCYPISSPLSSYFSLLSVKTFSQELELRKLYVLRSARLSKSAAGCDRLDCVYPSAVLFLTVVTVHASILTSLRILWIRNTIAFAVRIPHNAGNLQTYIHFGKSNALNKQCFRIAKCRTHQYLVSRCVLSGFSSVVQFAATHSFGCER